MKIFTVGDIKSKTINTNIKTLLSGNNIPMLKTVLNNTKDVESIAKLGVCISLIHEKESLQYFYSKLSKDSPWQFCLSDFYPESTDLVVSPLEYAFLYTTNIDIIGLLIDDTKDEAFFNICDKLNFDRKIMLMSKYDINLNYQHTHLTPSLILNRVLDNIDELNLLLTSGADPNLVDLKLNMSFIEYIVDKLPTVDICNLVLQINHVTSFYILLHFFEKVKDAYIYEGLYFMFHLFNRYKDDIYTIKDFIRYISIIKKINFMSNFCCRKDEQYFDAIAYSHYVYSIATKRIKSEQDKMDLQNIKVDDNRISLDTIIKNCRGNSPSNSKYRVSPKTLV